MNLVDNGWLTTNCQTGICFFGLSRAEKIEFTCDGKLINPTNSFEYLEITLDDDLSSDGVASSVIKKCVGDYVFYTGKVTFEWKIP